MTPKRYYPNPLVRPLETETIAMIATTCGMVEDDEMASLTTHATRQHAMPMPRNPRNGNGIGFCHACISYLGFLRNMAAIGLDESLRRKRAAAYDQDLEDSCRTWIEAVTGCVSLLSFPLSLPSPPSPFFSLSLLPSPHTKIILPNQH